MAREMTKTKKNVTITTEKKVETMTTIKFATMVGEGVSDFPNTIELTLADPVKVVCKERDEFGRIKSDSETALRESNIIRIRPAVIRRHITECGMFRHMIARNGNRINSEIVAALIDARVNIIVEYYDENDTYIDSDGNPQNYAAPCTKVWFQVKGL